MSKHWSNLAKIVAKRTYLRAENGTSENWNTLVERVVRGNLAKTNPERLLPREGETLEQLMLERKAMPGGRGLWYSGTDSHSKLGGAALNNCFYFSVDNWQCLVDIQDMLMLGGGCGASVEHRFVSNLPHVKSAVVTHVSTKDADFIIPDSREGWCELTRRVLEAFLETGKGFSYSDICVRPAGAAIAGFGGTASGAGPLINFIEKLTRILVPRTGRHLRPIDVCDIICAIGEMVVAGNVRRSAIILLGDPWDKEYLTGKRWDLGVLPTQRAMANWSVVASSTDDLHPLFWQTYEHGEPFGLVNRQNIQKYGRMGTLRPDSAVGVNPCGESTLESHEACNLQEINLHRLVSVDEFHLAARLMHRYGRRVAAEAYHNTKTAEVVARNQRIGTSITGCLAAPSLFTPVILDSVYQTLETENLAYAKANSVPESIRLTVVKPSGTLSKVMDTPWAPGIHGAYSSHFIQRIRFATNDPLVSQLRDAGHHIEPVVRFDNSLDPTTVVVDFYLETPSDVPTSDGDYSTWRQLDTLLMAQRHWADQAVSVTVYYRKADIPELKEWCAKNLQYLKAVSFLCHTDHGFKQAPWEAITQEAYQKGTAQIRELDASMISSGNLESQECEGGVCPVR